MGLLCGAQLKQQLFPQDRQYLAYIDVWLPEDAALATTHEAAKRAEDLILETAEPRTLESVTSWIGGGGPRFWSSASPEPSQLNYAEILIKTTDKHHTSHLLPELQRVLSTSLADDTHLHFKTSQTVLCLDRGRRGGSARRIARTRSR